MSSAVPAKSFNRVKSAFFLFQYLQSLEKSLCEPGVDHGPLDPQALHGCFAQLMNGVEKNLHTKTRDRYQECSEPVDGSAWASKGREKGRGPSSPGFSILLFHYYHFNRKMLFLKWELLKWNFSAVALPLQKSTWRPCTIDWPGSSSYDSCCSNHRTAYKPKHFNIASDVYKCSG